MKKAQLGFLTLIALIILLPVCFFQHEKNHWSEIDNRNLAELSENVSIDQTAQELKSYVNERIGFRYQMIDAYNRINKTLFHVFSHPDYDLGKEEELYPNIIENQLYDSYRQTFVVALEKMQHYCEDRGIKFYLMFDPNKISIYPEYIPDGVNYSSEWVDRFLEECANRGITVVDNYHYFKEIKDEVKLYNSKEDVAHWNDMGAFLGCNHVLRTLKEDFPAIEENRLEEMEVSEETVKYLQNSNIVINETVPRIRVPEHWVNIGEAEREALQKDATFANSAHFVSTSESDSSKPKILAFEGSYLYGGNHHAFLINQSREYITIHNYRNVLNLPYYVNVYQPDLVLFDVAEFVFAEYFFASSTMGNMIYPEAIKVYPYAEEEISLKSVEITEFTPAFRRIFVEVDSTDYQPAYVEFNGKTYDLEIVNGVYHLVTLSSNLEGVSELKFTFIDETNQKRYTAVHRLGE